MGYRVIIEGFILLCLQESIQILQIKKKKYAIEKGLLNGKRGVSARTFEKTLQSYRRLPD